MPARIIGHGRELLRWIHGAFVNDDVLGAMPEHANSPEHLDLLPLQKPRPSLAGDRHEPIGELDRLVGITAPRGDGDPFDRAAGGRGLVEHRIEDGEGLHRPQGTAGQAVITEAGRGGTLLLFRRASEGIAVQGGGPQCERGAAFEAGVDEGANLIVSRSPEFDSLGAAQERPAKPTPAFDEPGLPRRRRGIEK